MTQDEVQAEVVAEIREILAAFREQADYWNAPVAGSVGQRLLMHGPMEGSVGGAAGGGSGPDGDPLASVGAGGGGSGTYLGTAEEVRVNRPFNRSPYRRITVVHREGQGDLQTQREEHFLVGGDIPEGRARRWLDGTPRPGDGEEVDAAAVGIQSTHGPEFQLARWELTGDDARRFRDLQDAAREYAEDNRGNVFIPVVPDEQPAEHSAPLVTMFQRLLALLELSPGERVFVQDLADAATLGPMDGMVAPLEIFADWLEDQGRDADGNRIRRITPQTGDVLMLHLGVEAGTPQLEKAIGHARTLQDMLKAMGRHALVMVERAGCHYGCATEEDFARAGLLSYDKIKELMEGEPEAEANGVHASARLADMIQRLKRENSQLRMEGREAEQRARHFER